MVEQRSSKPFVWVRFLLSLYMLNLFKRKKHKQSFLQPKRWKKKNYKNYRKLEIRHRFNKVVRRIKRTLPLRGTQFRITRSPLYKSNLVRLRSKAFGYGKLKYKSYLQTSYRVTNYLSTQGSVKQIFFFRFNRLQLNSTHRLSVISFNKTQTLKKLLDSLRTNAHWSRGSSFSPSSLDSVLSSLYYSTKDLINPTVSWHNRSLGRTPLLLPLLNINFTEYFKVPVSTEDGKNKIVWSITDNMNNFNSLSTYVNFFHTLRRLSTLDKMSQRRKFSFSTASRIHYDYVLSEDIHRGSFAKRTLFKESQNKDLRSPLKLKRSEFTTRTQQPKTRGTFRYLVKGLRDIKKFNTKPRTKIFKRRRWSLIQLRRSLRSQVRFTKKRIFYLTKKLSRKIRKTGRKLKWKKRFIIRALNVKRKLRRFFNNSPKQLIHSFKSKLKVNQGRLVVKGSKHLEKKFGKIMMNISSDVRLTPTFLTDNNYLSRFTINNSNDSPFASVRFVSPANKFFIDPSTAPSHFLTRQGFSSSPRLNLSTLKVLMIHPLIENPYNSTPATTTRSSLHTNFQSWLIKFQNYAETTLFSHHNKSVRLSNLWSLGRSDFLIRKKLARAAAPTLFRPRLANWYYVTLVRFLEASMGRKVALTFGPFVEDSLSFQEKAKCVIWANRLRGFQRMLGKRIFLVESTRIILASLKLKDPTLLSNWIRAMLKRMSFWKYRLIFRYLDFLIRHFIKTYFAHIAVRGFKLQLKGKISVAGNARTRTLFYRVGDTSHAKIDNKVAYHLSLVNSFTGVMGLKVWIFY